LHVFLDVFCRAAHFFVIFPSTCGAARQAKREKYFFYIDKFLASRLLVALRRRKSKKYEKKKTPVCNPVARNL